MYSNLNEIESNGLCWPKEKGPCSHIFTFTTAYWSTGYCRLVIIDFHSLQRPWCCQSTMLDCHAIPKLPGMWTLTRRMERKIITKTCLYNVDLLKPHFYRVKLGFTGVYNIILISAQKHRLWVLIRTASRLWYSLEPPHRGGSNEYPQSMFWAVI